MFIFLLSLLSRYWFCCCVKSKVITCVRFLFAWQR